MTPDVAVPPAIQHPVTITSRPLACEGAASAI